MADLSLITAGQVAPVYPHSALDDTYDIICGVAVTGGQVIYQNTSGKAALSDANAGSGAEKAIGIVLRTKGAGQGVSYLTRGRVYGFDLSSLAYGALVYLSDTPGALSDTPSTTNSVAVGRVEALSNSDLTKVLNLSFRVVPGATAGAVFVSAEQTGTGSAQNVAHGLGVIPRFVVIVPTDLTPATTGSYVVTEGTHTTTNVVVTVTTSKKFKVLAFA
jgi:hypothetical protein